MTEALLPRSPPRLDARAGHRGADRQRRGEPGHDPEVPRGHRARHRRARRRGARAGDGRAAAVSRIHVDPDRCSCRAPKQRSRSGEARRRRRSRRSGRPSRRSSARSPAWCRRSCVGKRISRAATPARRAASTQRVLDHRGTDPFAPVIPLAHLGLARAWRRAATRTRAVTSTTSSSRSGRTRTRICRRSSGRVRSAHGWTRRAPPRRRRHDEREPASPGRGRAAWRRRRALPAGGEAGPRQRHDHLPRARSDARS